MGCPRLVVFARHAESEGNLLTASERTRLEKGTPHYGITEFGEQQLRITSAWLHEHYGEFDAYYASYYRRALESLMGLCPNVEIYEDSRLAEAQRGIHHVVSDRIFAERYPDEAARREREGFYHYRPLGGENWPDVELRAESFHNMLKEEHDGEGVLCIVHGNWLLCYRRIVERLSIEELLRFYHHEAPRNASVTIYRREETGKRPRLALDAYNIVPWEGILDPATTRS